MELKPHWNLFLPIMGLKPFWILYPMSSESWFFSTLAGGNRHNFQHYVKGWYSDFYCFVMLFSPATLQLSVLNWLHERDVCRFTVFSLLSSSASATFPHLHGISVSSQLRCLPASAWIPLPELWSIAIPESSAGQYQGSPGLILVLGDYVLCCLISLFWKSFIHILYGFLLLLLF